MGGRRKRTGTWDVCRGVGCGSRGLGAGSWELGVGSWEGGRREEEGGRWEEGGGRDWRAEIEARESELVECFCVQASWDLTLEGGRYILHHRTNRTHENVIHDRDHVRNRRNQFAGVGIRKIVGVQNPASEKHGEELRGFKVDENQVYPFLHLFKFDTVFQY
jgi:hypothetical protein